MIIRNNKKYLFEVFGVKSLQTIAINCEMRLSMKTFALEIFGSSLKTKCD